MSKFRPVRLVVFVAMAALAMVACGSREHQDSNERLAAMEQAIADLRTQIQTNQQEILNQFRKVKATQLTMISRGVVISPEAAKKVAQVGDKTDITIGGAPSLGRADAPVEVVEFADFQCPFCIRQAGYLEQLVEKNPNRIRVGFRHYPLKSHRLAVDAAKGAWAAQQQGKFWEMHDALFSAQGKIDEEVIREQAEAIGLDMEKFDEDWKSPEALRAVFADRKAGAKAGVKGTPTYYVNGVLIGGNLRSVNNAVRRALARAGGAEKPAS